MRQLVPLLLAACLLAAPAFAQGYAKGVNPADNLTRADAALAWIALDEEELTALVVGYEHRLSTNWGLGAALTPLAHFDGDYGTGDLGGRVRYIEHVGDWHLGASLAAFSSSNEPSVLGKDRYRLVPALLAVRPWSAEDFTAVHASWVNWISSSGDFATFRVEQGHLFASGWFLVGSGFWETDLGAGHRDYGFMLEAGKQLDERWQIALQPGYSLRGSADPQVLLRTAYFF